MRTVLVTLIEPERTTDLDKGVSWVWSHGGAHVASEPWHGIEHGADWAWHEGGSLVHTGEHVVHDLEPWNWSL